MELWKIFFGLVTAAFLIHFREAYLLAQKQRAVITRLHSYLLYWRTWVIDNDVFKFFYLGMEWNKEIRKRVAQGEGAEGLVKLKEEKRKEIDELRLSLEKEEHKLDIAQVKKQLDRLPKDTIAHMLRHNERFEQNLLEGKTFINDEDATSLGPYYAHICVRLKMNIIGAASKVITQLITFVGAPEAYSVKDSAKELAEIVWKGVLISKDVDELSDYVQKARKRSLLRDTWGNLWL